MPLQDVVIGAPINALGKASTRRLAPTPDVVWISTPFLQNRPQNTFFSDDAALRMSGVGAATATVTLEDVTGASAATLGITMNGNTLECSALVVGTGVFRYVANYNGQDFPSSNFTVSIDAQTTDTLDPTVPVFKTWGAVGDDRIDFSISPGMDPVKVGVSTALGLASLRIERRENSGAWSQTEELGIPVGESPEMEFTTIGSIPGTPSAVQSSDGKDWTFTATSGGTNGHGFVDTADGLYFPHFTHSGDFTCKKFVPEFSGIVGSFSADSLMCREDLDADSKAVEITYRTDNTTGNVTRCQMRYRAEKGGSVISLGAVQNITGEVVMFLQRAGNVFTGWAWQPTTGQLTFLGSVTLSMTPLVRVGFPPEPRSGDSSTITVTNREISVTSTADISISHTGLNPGSTYDYRSTVVDDGGRVSDYSPIVQIILPNSGAVVYNNVKARPPTLSNPATYLTYASFPGPTEEPGYFSGGGGRLEQGPGFQHIFNGGGGDILVDLRGDFGSVVQYPCNFKNYRNLIIRGIDMLLTEQATTAPGLLDQRQDEDPGGKNNYYRAAAGGFCIRLDGLEESFIDGCSIDANKHEADYIVFRNKDGNPSQRESCIVTVRNSLFLNNEGEKPGLHADWLHNQGNFGANRDPITHPFKIITDNLLCYQGMNGCVIHKPISGNNQQSIFDLRRSVFIVINDNQAPAAVESVGPPIGSAKGGAADLISEDVWYGTYKDGKGGLLVGANFAITNTNNWSLTDPAVGSGTAWPGLFYGKVGSAIGGTLRRNYVSGPHSGSVSEFPTFGLEKQYLGPNYQLPVGG